MELFVGLGGGELLKNALPFPGIVRMGAGFLKSRLCVSPFLRGGLLIAKRVE